MDHTKTLLDYALTQGLAVVMLFVFLFSAAVVVRLVWLHVALPMKDAAVRHLEETNKHMQRNSECMDKLSDTLGEVCSTMRTIGPKIDDIHRRTQPKGPKTE